MSDGIGREVLYLIIFYRPWWTRLKEMPLRIHQKLRSFSQGLHGALRQAQLLPVFFANFYHWEYTTLRYKVYRPKICIVLVFPLFMTCDIFLMFQSYHKEKEIFVRVSYVPSTPSPTFSFFFFL